MPTAPNYGLLGLAQGAGSLPMDIAEGQNSALALKLRGIQAQEAQRQLSQAKAEDVAGSMSISPKMQTVPGTPAQYGPAPTPSPQTSSTGEGEPLNAPPASMPQGEGEAIPPQVQTQAATPETKKPYEFTTDYERMAYETQQMADRLRSMGMGRSAMLHQKEALQYQQQHITQARGQAVQAMISGDYAGALKNLHSIGQTAVVNVGQTTNENGDTLYYAEDAQGNKTYMDHDDLTALATDPSQMAKIMAEQGKYNAQMKAWGYRSDNSLKGKLAQVAAAKEIASGHDATSIAVHKAMAESPGKDPMWWKNVKLLADQLTKEAATQGKLLDPVAAVKQARGEVPAPGSAHTGMSVAQQVNSLRGEQHDLRATYMGRVDRVNPDSTSPYAKYQALQKRIEELRKSVGQSATNDLGPAVARDKAGKEVFNSGGKYVYADGTEYKP